MVFPKLTPVELSYRMERADYLAFCEAIGRPLWKRLLISVGIFVATFVFVATLSGGASKFARNFVALFEERPPYVLIGAVAGGVAISLLVQTVGVRLQRSIHYRRTAIAGRELRMTFTPDHIEVFTDQVRSEIPWSIVRKLIRTGAYYFLRISQREAIIVPRRAFSQESDAEQLLQLVEAHTVSTTRIY